MAFPIADGSSQLHHAPPIISAPRLSNKLSKLTLATFDEQGKCHHIRHSIFIVIIDLWRISPTFLPPNSLLP